MESDELKRLYTLHPIAIWQRLRREHISFWCVCGYLFFEYVRPQTIYPWLDFFPWAFTFIIAALILSFTDKAPKPEGNILNKLMVTYGAIVLLSSVFAVDTNLAFANLSSFFNWLVIYFVIVRLVHTRQRFFIFFFLYILANLKMAQHGFLVWVFRGFSFHEHGVSGAPGFFSNSGEFGIQLTIFLPLAIVFVLALRGYWSRWVRLLFYFMPVSAGGAILASSSRGAILGAAALSLWAIKSSKYFFRAILIVGAVASLSWYVTPDEFKARFEVAGDASDRTSKHRLDRWAAGWDLMQNKPLLGVGHKNWTKYYKKYYSDGSKQSLMIHNMFMESGTEHGFLGLFTLLFILFSMFKLNARVRAHALEHGMNFEALTSKGMDAAIIGMAVSSCFVTVLSYPYVWIHAAFVVALYNSTFSSEVT